MGIGDWLGIFIVNCFLRVIAAEEILDFLGILDFLDFLEILEILGILDFL